MAGVCPVAALQATLNPAIDHENSAFATTIDPVAPADSHCLRRYPAGGVDGHVPAAGSGETTV